MSVFPNKEVLGFSFHVDTDKMDELYLSGRGLELSELKEMVYITMENEKFDTVCKVIFKLGTHFRYEHGEIFFIDKIFDDSVARLAIDGLLSAVINKKNDRLILRTFDESLRINNYPDAILVKVMEYWYKLTQDLRLVNEYCGDSRVLKYRFKNLLNK